MYHDLNDWIDVLCLQIVDYIESNPNECLIEIPVPTELVSEYDTEDIEIALSWLPELLKGHDEIEKEYRVSYQERYHEVRLEEI